MAGVSPVFFKAENRRFTNHDVCWAVENCAGFGSCHGAQKIGQLWRVYLTNSTHRINLLSKGIVVNGEKIELSPRNPFIMRDGAGNEVPITKLFIRDIPISYADDEL